MKGEGEGTLEPLPCLRPPDALVLKPAGGLRLTGTGTTAGATYAGVLSALRARARWSVRLRVAVGRMLCRPFELNTHMSHGIVLMIARSLQGPPAS